jgi:hypothetical protein
MRVGDDESSALASTIVARNPDVQKAKDTVASYHETCLRELTEHIADAVDKYRAGDIDAFEVEAIIHQYH